MLNYCGFVAWSGVRGERYRVRLGVEDAYDCGCRTSRASGAYESSVAGDFRSDSGRLAALRKPPLE